jgi:hypothetical protein
MTIENDFVIFASSAGANVMSVAEYLANASTSIGYVNGVADPTSVNVALRQGTSASAVLAAFIVEFSGQPAIDNGNAAELLANFITALQTLGRIKMTAALNLFVATTGSDTANTGLLAASPFKTIQHAVMVATNAYDTGGFPININVANGTYTVGAETTSALVGGGALNFVGNITTPADCIIDVTNGTCFTIGAGETNISGFTLAATGSSSGAGNAILAAGTAIADYTAINFDQCTNNHILAASGGNIGATAGATATILGGATAHFGSAQGFINVDIAVSIPAAIGFTTFASASTGGAIEATGSTFTGSGVAGTTGVRFNVTLNGIIETGGGGADFFPGSAAGTASSGGQVG